MEWTPGGTSDDIEDRRDESGGDGGGGGGGGFGFGGGGFGGIHLGIGGTLLLLVLSFFFHTNLFQFFSGSPGATESPSRYRSPDSAPDNALDEQEKPEGQFVSFILDDVQKNWDRVLPAQTNVPYRHAKLVLFRDAYPSGCGSANTATGPFYCPEDQKVYLDLGFFKEL